MCVQCVLCVYLCLTIFSRELFVWLEMVPNSGTDFRKVDAGAVRYACLWLCTRKCKFSGVHYSRHGFVVLEASNVPKGNFIISAITLSQLPRTHVPFFITLYSDNVFNFEPC